MPSTAAKLGWSPLRMALAWVFTRDVEFSHEVMRIDRSTLDGALALYNWANVRAVSQALESHQVWPLLRESISTGAIRARGVPIEPDIESEEYWPDDEEWGPENRLNSPVSEIELPATEVATLLLATRRSETRLSPRDWHFKGGRWWCDVVIAQDDLLRVFPEVAADAGDNPKDHKREAAAKTMRALFGENGPPRGVSHNEALRRLNKQLKDDRKDQVSDSTYRRALKDLRSERK